ncbi:MAG: carbamoyltransferase HypF [Oscillospiraceae bacterium]|nr:carbamoyltransferase HypF [Oscillospiraceae bacterium]
MSKIHAEIRINGIVQGVGFRPFIHRRVSEFSLAGEIRNTSSGVALLLEGEEEKIKDFLATLSESAPPLLEIHGIKSEFSETLSGYTRFSIVQSESGKVRDTLISPDTAICDDCLRELFDERDRRFRYPFINCTNCGPRFTITCDIPYDRKNTTMSPFPMCPPCAAEYSDIESRRYHAQPDCCPDCGPELIFLNAEGERASGDALESAKKLLRSGGICAIKGVGGVHLAVRADIPEAVRELRGRKKRDERPFAVMCRDVETARKLAEVSEEEEKLLTSHRRPIILLKKKNKKEYMQISENGYIGVMLPYTPLHYLLMEERELSCLVMTSANLSHKPIVYKDEEMLASLSGVADGFLTNNREIFVRCDDSLAWEYEGHEYFARRSRGYAPHPVLVPDVRKKILACGAEQKASFSLSRAGQIFPSAHIGDLKNLETLDCYVEQTAHFEKIFDISPELIVCDMHPDYMSTEYAKERAKALNVPLVGTYHHHAHMASCMADNGLDCDCIGIIWDGVGYGEGGKILGAEFLYGGYESFERLGTMEEITLPGGDVATREIERIGISLALSAGEDASEIFADSGKIKKLVAADINCPKTSGMGRLFDGVAAILGIKNVATYEGQGAMLLEAAASESCERVYPYKIIKKDGMHVFDWRGMISGIISEKKSGTEVSENAAAFMNTLVAVAVRMTQHIATEKNCRKVVLSGGCFQNMYILKRLVPALESEGLEVFTHKRVSTNDEGISLGQLMIAEKGGGINVSCSST